MGEWRGEGGCAHAWGGVGDGAGEIDAETFCSARTFDLYVVF